IGGLIAGYNYELLFWVDGITNLVAAIVLFVMLKPELSNRSEAQTKEKEVVPLSFSAYKDKTYLWFIFLIVLFAFCFFQLFSTVPKYLRDNLLLNERFIGFTMAVNG